MGDAQCHCCEASRTSSLTWSNVAMTANQEADLTVECKVTRLQDERL